MHLAKKHVRTAIRGQGRIKFTSPYRTYDHVVTNIRVDAWVTSFTTRKAKCTWTQRARAPTRKINNSNGWISHNIWSVDARYKQRDDRRVVQVLRLSLRCRLYQHPRLHKQQQGWKQERRTFSFVFKWFSCLPAVDVFLLLFAYLKKNGHAHIRISRNVNIDHTLWNKNLWNYSEMSTSSQRNQPMYCTQNIVQSYPIPLNKTCGKPQNLDPPIKNIYGCLSILKIVLGIT